MKKLIFLLLLVANYPSIAQYNLRSKSNTLSSIRELNALSITDSDLIYKVAIAPQYTLNQSPFSGAGGYWRGLSIRDISRDKFFESTYYYDMQGNLRETRSFFNIKRKGQITNWRIQVPTYRQSSPVFVHTF